MANEKSQPQESQTASKHIRPRIQRKSPMANKQTGGKDTDATADVEDARKKMESWMGLGSNSRKNTSSASSNSKQTARAKDNGSPMKTITPTVIESNQNDRPQKQQQQPVSILKRPKYSGAARQVVAVDAAAAASSSSLVSTTRVILGNSGSSVVSAAGSNEQLPQSLQQAPLEKSSFICKDVVVERDPTMAVTKIKSFRRTNRNKDPTNCSSNNNNNNPPHVPSPATTSAAHHASIEGYIPASSGMMNAKPLKQQNQNPTPASSSRNNNNNKSNGICSSENDGNEKDDEPLVINSLEGLMRAAGEPLPSNLNKITKDTKMVEANISFSVMTQDQYETKLPVMKEENEEERQRQLGVFMGKHDIFEDDNERIEGALEGDGIRNGDEYDDDDDDDAVMELLLGSDIDDADDENECTLADRPIQVKAFALLWDAMTNWMTHETVVWMKSLRETFKTTQNHDLLENSNGHSKNYNNNNSNMDTEWTPMVDKSDIGASRCAGVMAMLRLYLGRCMEELGHPVESRRKAEKRLNDLMRTFDYSRENPKLTAGHWKAMACVLLDAVLIETRGANRLPISVAKMGMTKAEFEYLSRKAVLIFEQ